MVRQEAELLHCSWGEGWCDKAGLCSQKSRAGRSVHHQYRCCSLSLTMQGLHCTNESPPLLHVNPAFPAPAVQFDVMGVVGTGLQPSSAFPEDAALVWSCMFKPGPCSGNPGDIRIQDIRLRIWGMIYCYFWNPTISHLPWKHPNSTLLVKDQGNSGYQSSCQKLVVCLMSKDRPRGIPPERGLLEGMGRRRQRTENWDWVT